MVCQDPRWSPADRQAVIAALWTDMELRLGQLEHAYRARLTQTRRCAARQGTGPLRSFDAVLRERDSADAVSAAFVVPEKPEELRLPSD